MTPATAVWLKRLISGGPLVKAAWSPGGPIAVSFSGPPDWPPRQLAAMLAAVSKRPLDQVRWRSVRLLWPRAPEPNQENYGADGSGGW